MTILYFETSIYEKKYHTYINELKNDEANRVRDYTQYFILHFEILCDVHVFLV